MHCCTLTAGGALRVPCWQILPTEAFRPLRQVSTFLRILLQILRWAEGACKQSTCKATQQDLRGRPPLRILLALESATQACRHGVKQRCWEQQSAWQQAERLLWAHAAPFKVWLVKRHRTCCSGTQRMVVPPADHSKCRLLPITNSFGLCMDSWLNSNQGKAITISQLRGRHCSGHHLPSRIHSYSIR